MLFPNEMFEYLLMMFGMNVNNRYANHFVTGLTVATFPALFLRLLNLRLESQGLFFIEFFVIIILFLNFISYLLMEFKIY